MASASISSSSTVSNYGNFTKTEWMAYVQKMEADLQIVLEVTRIELEEKQRKKEAVLSAAKKPENLTGPCLKYVRQLLGLTQKAVADEVTATTGSKIHQASISQFEREVSGNAEDKIKKMVAMWLRVKYPENNND